MFQWRFNEVLGFQSHYTMDVINLIEAMNVGVYASTCIHFMYTDVYTWLYICLYAVEFQRAERNGQALGITREQLTTLRPAGIAQWQKPRTWSSKSVPIYWPPKKFGWIFSIDAQTTLRTFRCVDCWLVEWKEGWDLFPECVAKGSRL